LPTLSSVGASLALPCFRFHTPLNRPDVRFAASGSSEKNSRNRTAIACDAVCNFWNNSELSGLSPNLLSSSRLASGSTEAFPLSGVTRLRQYYEPLRHPVSPAFFSHELPVDPHCDHRWDFPWCTLSTLPACRRQIPRRFDGILFARTFPSTSALPRNRAGQLLHYAFSRPAQRLLTLRPCMLAESPMRPLHPKASAASLTLHCIRLLRVSRNQFPGGS